MSGSGSEEFRAAEGRSDSGLQRAVTRLAAHYGDPPGPPAADAFELIVYENVAYLAPDDRRRAAFEQLRTKVGLRPASLARASTQDLEAVTAAGILKGTSAEKLRRCAEIAIKEFGGDLSPVLEQPDTEARRALQRFPGIGEPGAEKILLFARGRPFLAPDSNGLRVLTRLGLVREEASYARTYANARVKGAELGADAATLQRAHSLLRLHGQVLCRRRRPLCAACPLRAECLYYRTLETKPET
jgi:endonuclease III